MTTALLQRVQMNDLYVDGINFRLSRCRRGSGHDCQRRPHGSVEKVDMRQRGRPKRKVAFGDNTAIAVGEVRWQRESSPLLPSQPTPCRQQLGRADMPWRPDAFAQTPRCL